MAPFSTLHRSDWRSGLHSAQTVLDPTDERDVETGLGRGYSGTTRRKGRQQANQTYRYRATSRYWHQPTARDGCHSFPVTREGDVLFETDFYFLRITT